MAHEATLTLDPDRLDRFVAEAEMAMRRADAALREPDDPRTVFVGDERVGAEWSRERADLLRRTGDDAGDSIGASVGLLRRHTLVGRPGRRSGTPFPIARRAEAEVVMVPGLFHGAQDWPNMP